jgi:hypothetical protein
MASKSRSTFPKVYSPLVHHVHLLMPTLSWKFLTMPISSTFYGGSHTTVLARHVQHGLARDASTRKWGGGVLELSHACPRHMPPSANSVLLHCGRNEGATLYYLKVLVLHYQEYLLQQDLLLGSRYFELCAAQSLSFPIWKAMLAVVELPPASTEGPLSWLLGRPQSCPLPRRPS